MKKYLLTPFLILSLFSCKSNENEGYTNRLALVDSLKILLPEYGNYSLSYIQLYDNEEEEILFGGNVINNSIDIFNLNQEKYKTRIEFQKNGPNALSNLQGFYVINFDSILVFPNSMLHRSLLINLENTQIEEFRIQDFDNLDPKIINHVSSSSNPVIYNGKTLSFIQYPLFDVEDPNNINRDFDFEQIYDLTEKKFYDGGIKYPEFYQNKIWSIFSTLLFRTSGKNQTSIYSWSLSDSIYVKSSSGKLKSYIAKGMSSKKVSPFSHKPEHSERIKKTIENTNYKGIFYDKYRDVYYRIVLNPTEYNPQIHNDYKAFFDQPISIITLDNKFNQIDETLLSKNKYTYSSMFVGRKGLYISKANVKNNFFDEDFLMYDIFILNN